MPDLLCRPAGKDTHVSMLDKDGCTHNTHQVVDMVVYSTFRLNAAMPAILKPPRRTAASNCPYVAAVGWQQLSDHQFDVLALLCYTACRSSAVRRSTCKSLRTELLCTLSFSCWTSSASGTTTCPVSECKVPTVPSGNSHPISCENPYVRRTPQPSGMRSTQNSDCYGQCYTEIVPSITSKKRQSH